MDSAGFMDAGEASAVVDGVEPSDWRPLALERVTRRASGGKRRSPRQEASEPGEPAPLDCTAAYMRDVSRLGLLTPEEERALGRRVQRGDAEARARMIESNLRLVIMTARRYMNRSLSLDDLIEEGNLGLIRAVEKFDPELGFRFSTYAMRWIRQSIELGLQNHGRLVRLPSHVSKAVARCKRQEARLMASLGRRPSEQEIAAAVGEKVQTVRNLLRFDRSAEAASRAADECDGSADGVAADHHDWQPEMTLAGQELRQLLEASLDHLEPRAREIVCRRFGLRGYEPHTLEEAGAAVCLARERTRQLQGLALRQLRDALQATESAA